jgi:hypothetical protein
VKVPVSASISALDRTQIDRRHQNRESSSNPRFAEPNSLPEKLVSMIATPKAGVLQKIVYLNKFIDCPLGREKPFGACLKMFPAKRTSRQIHRDCTQKLLKENREEPNFQKLILFFLMSLYVLISLYVFK